VPTPARDRIPAFTDIGPDDLPRVGGKGLNLGAMVRDGAPVPPGFCVTTEAFRAFVQTVPAFSDLTAAVDGLDADDVDGVRRHAAAVREAMVAAPLPADLGACIAAAFAPLDDGGGWAVRSSATLEDLPEASFAGQQDTYLNVRGADALLDAVRRCWASLFTDRAVLYRRKNGFGSAGAHLSVVVQRMVVSDVSGILFTADPLTGHRRVASIDSSYGLGEALVSGLVDADNFRFDRRSRTVIEQRLGAKKIEIVGMPDGGTEQREVGPERAAVPSLDAATIERLVAIAEAIEAQRGAPQDIEWCLQDGELYVVQTRAITTLFPAPSPRGDGLRIYASFNHVQVMLDPFRPLAFDFARWLLPFGKPAADAPSNTVEHIGGRIYADLTPALLRTVGAKLIPQGMTAIDPVMAEIIGAAAARPEFLRKDGRAPGNLRTFALSVGRKTFPTVLGTLFLWDPWRIRRRTTERFEAFHADRMAFVPEGDDPAALFDDARRRASVLFDFLLPNFIAIAMPGMLAYRRLAKLVAGFSTDAETEAVVRGLEGSETTEMDLRLGDMADAARPVRVLSEALRRDAPGAAVEGLRGVDGTARFFEIWDGFIARYGHRGPSEIDLSQPRWGEDPRSLYRTLAGMLASEPGVHRMRHREMGRTAVEVGESLIRRTPWWKRPIARRLLTLTHALAPLRENGKFAAMAEFGAARRCILAGAELLVERGVLADADDVWLFSFEELASVTEQEPAEVRSLVAERRGLHERHKLLRPPRVLTSDGEAPLRAPTEVGPGELAGFSASTGIYEGVARVVLDPREEVLESGEILVAPFTDPGWTPLFVHASALVMEVGGLMTHGSVVAREYGIPAVVGVDDATTRIRTGDRIRIDGDTGRVVLLAEVEGTS